MKLSKFPKEQIDQWGLLVLLILTLFAFFIAHIDYARWEWRYPSTFNYDAINHVPWIRSSILMCFITYLCANTKSVFEDDSAVSTIIFTTSIVPITILLIYPMNENFEKEFGNTIIAVAFVHAFGFKILRDAYIRNHEYF